MLRPVLHGALVASRTSVRINGVKCFKSETPFYRTTVPLHPIVPLGKYHNLTKENTVIGKHAPNIPRALRATRNLACKKEKLPRETTATAFQLKREA